MTLDVINSILSRTENTLIEPDNSLSIDNPDALIWNGDILIGFYIATRDEIRNPSSLLRRLQISRLSYINGLRTILFVPEYDNGKEVSSVVSNMFDVYIQNDCTEDDIHRLLKGRIDITHNLDSRIREMVIHRFWRYERLNIALLANSDIQKYKRFQPSYYQDKERNIVSSKAVSSPFYRSNSMKYCFKQRSANTFRRSYNSILNALMYDDFYFQDKGITDWDSRNFFDMDYFRVVNTEWDFKDKSKYRKALSFMGLAISSVESEEQLYISLEYVQNKGI